MYDISAKTDFELTTDREFRLNLNAKLTVGEPVLHCPATKPYKKSKAQELKTLRGQGR